jgi:hypothetical protein
MDAPGGQSHEHHERKLPMSNRSHETTQNNPAKGQNPERPNLPKPGQNPDFPPGSPIGPEPDSSSGGTTTTPTK